MSIQALVLVPTHSHGYIIAFLTSYLRARQNRRNLLDLRLWSVAKVEDIVANQDGQDRLNRTLNQYDIPVSDKECITLNSVIANCRPRQVRGPSLKDKMWWYPDTSFAFDVRPDSSSSQRSGLNSFASGPQISSERLMARIGARTAEPRATVIWSTSSPDAVFIGVLNGITSSHEAYRIAC